MVVVYVASVVVVCMVVSPQSWRSLFSGPAPASVWCMVYGGVCRISGGGMYVVVVVVSPSSKRTCGVCMVYVVASVVSTVGVWCMYGGGGVASVL